MKQPGTFSCPWDVESNLWVLVGAAATWYVSYRGGNAPYTNVILILVKGYLQIQNDAGDCGPSQK